MAGTKAELVRAVRGPIMLITLGALFALEHMNHVPFHRTWPLLLIVLGALKLAERLAARQPDEPQEPGSPFIGGGV